MSSQDVINPVTLANVGRGAWDGISQENPFFGELKKKGSIEYDVEGGTDSSTLNSSTYELSGSIEAGRYRPFISAPGQDISGNYQSKTRFKRWSTNFGEICMTVPFDRGALRRNKGSSIVDLSKTEIPAMFRDLIVADSGLAWQLLQLNSQTYSGGGLPFHGLPSFLPGNGSTVSSANVVAAYTMATAITDWDLEGYAPPSGAGNGTLSGSAPADTDKEVAIGGAPTYVNYLGLSLKQGGLTGVDNLEYDAWSPTLVNSSATTFSGTADDEANAIEKFLSYCVFRGSRFSAADKTKKPNMGLLDKTFFEYLGAKKASRETVFVMDSKANTDVADMGYPCDVIRHQGINWFWDENMPSETGYVLNTNQMKLKIQPLYKNLIGGSPLTVSGEDAGIIETEVVPDPVRRQFLCNATIPGQLVAMPRYFVRVSNYS